MLLYFENSDGIETELVEQIPSVVALEQQIGKITIAKTLYKGNC